MFDYLIVGAGFAGAVLAERLAGEMGKKAEHMAANAFAKFRYLPPKF